MRCGVAGRLVKNRNVQLAAHALVDFVHAAAKSVHPGQQTQRLGIDLFTLRGQRKAGPAASTQGEPQAGFQVLDMAAHRRDADVELQLGRGHAAALGHTFEHAQQANVHIAQLAQRGPALYLHRLPTW